MQEVVGKFRSMQRGKGATNVHSMTLEWQGGQNAWMAKHAAPLLRTAINAGDFTLTADGKRALDMEEQSVRVRASPNDRLLEPHARHVFGAHQHYTTQCACYLPAGRAQRDRSRALHRHVHNAVN